MASVHQVARTSTSVFALARPHDHASRLQLGQAIVALRLVFGISQSLLPNPIHPVLIENRVGAHQRDVLDPRLRRQEPVERVTMVEG